MKLLIVLLLAALLVSARAAVAQVEIGYGCKGSVFVLSDFATFDKHENSYPQIAELTPFPEGLRNASPDLCPWHGFG